MEHNQQPTRSQSPASGSTEHWGHRLQPYLITEHSLRSRLTTKPGLWPNLNTESSQQHHLIRKHSLRFTQMGTIVKHGLKLCPIREASQGHPLARKHSLHSHPKKGDYRVLLVDPHNHTIQPEALPEFGVQPADLLKCRAQLLVNTPQPSPPNFRASTVALTNERPQ